MLYGRVCDLKFLATHLDSYNLSTPSITGICSSICIYRFIYMLHVYSQYKTILYLQAYTYNLLARSLCTTFHFTTNRMYTYMYVDLSKDLDFYYTQQFWSCFLCFFFVFFYLSGLHSYQFECGFRLYKIKVENLCVLLYKYKKIINRLKYLDFACLFVCFFLLLLRFLFRKNVYKNC